MIIQWLKDLFRGGSVEVFGSPLAIERLDLSGIGLYETKDPNVPSTDYLLTAYTSFGKPLYKRASEEGVKWFEYKDTEIRLQGLE
jgi:hypothetical protein